MNKQSILGVDVGSTTVKLALIEPGSGHIQFERYLRHGARQAATTAAALEELADAIGDQPVLPIFTGSGARILADRSGMPFVQEVVANSVAVARYFPECRVAIELGGQDAKIVFFHHDEATGESVCSDMRMNGSCAGGTGAFIDEVAGLLRTRVEEFDTLAAGGTTLYQISGRCGVFAKTDIQPLLNQGVSRADLALSTFHAVARQTIGGLAQGLTIAGPVVFEGGPLTFNPTLVDVFAERLGLAAHEVLKPDRPELFVAIGAALALPRLTDERTVITARELATHVLAGAIRDDGGPAGAATDGAPGTAAPARSRSHGIPSSADGVAAADTVAPLPFFAEVADRAAFDERHRRPSWSRRTFGAGTTVPVTIGVDAGSTTTKVVILDDDGELLDAGYSANGGEPLATGIAMLRELLGRYRDEGVTLDIRGLGTTGYGERLFAAALHADYHTVETVAHAHAARTIAPDASFVLDIGGQDIKAISITDGIVTGITLNEACSAGCGSFLENFASTLSIPVEEIATRAFRADNPSVLGSRCTVFMNSSIITEQKNGKGPDDILAGLCRSIVENLFTKVVRVPNFDRLGRHVVVQGGTFENDAVLRAFEQFTGRTVTRAPFPGLMGAIGVGLLTQARAGAGPSRFAGLAALEAFEASHESGHICPYCANACNRTVVRFGDGGLFVTGNRCERGEVVEGAAAARVTVGAGIEGGAGRAGSAAAVEGGATHEGEAAREAGAPAVEGEAAREVGAPAVEGEATHEGEAPAVEGEAPDARERLREIARRRAAVPNLFTVRERLYARDAGLEPLCASTGTTIGIPRALEFWHSLPFWRTLWQQLGYTVVVSQQSSQELFENGLPSVPSDTVCFPAKLAHGHLLDLIERRVDRIFMPMVNRMVPENRSTASNHVCAVVKGYPMVLAVSDEPEARHGIPFDKPIFHWVDERSRRRQIMTWLTREFGIDPRIAAKAIRRADDHLEAIRQELRDEGARVLDSLAGTDRFAVVLAGRPYHSDRLVNHDLPEMLVSHGVPVLTLDSVPGLDEVDLSRTRAELTINFHARMFAGGLIASRHPNLELIQVVSFGCGHDAIITDEVIRLMEESSSKTPLTLKLDETDARGPLLIRVRSFLETVNARRARESGATAAAPNTSGGTPAIGGDTPGDLPDPFPVKYRRAHRRERVIMAPNVSRAFAQVISAAIRAEGYRIEPLPMADRRAIELGKRYVHNDMCFPAQVNVGELLRALERGDVARENVSCGLAKSQCDCRLAHYATLARRALDDAGYAEVPIITTDIDTKNMHPGFKLSPIFQLRMLWALAIIDALEELRRRIRPYERIVGATDRVFERSMQAIAAGIERSPKRAMRAFEDAVDAMGRIEQSDEPDRPQVFVIGEFLLNFHPTSNFNIERYLEEHGMEVVMPNILDSFRRDFMRQKTERTEFFVRHPFAERALAGVTDRLFDHVLARVHAVAQRHPRFHARAPLPEIARLSEEIVHHTFTAGEGWMIAGEILYHAAHGVKSFLILQPFGCLPNHVTGRGIVKRLKQLYPAVQILSLDYDPDTSFANIENRLQMMILSSRMNERREAAAETA